jgi:hypothetical protein
VHSANLDPSPESMSLESCSGHPRRYMSNCTKGVELSVDAHDFQKCRQIDIRAGKKSTSTEPGLPAVTVSIPASSANRTYSSSAERTVWPYVIFIIVPAANLVCGVKRELYAHEDMGVTPPADVLEEGTRGYKEATQ